MIIFSYRLQYSFYIILIVKKFYMWL